MRLSHPKNQAAVAVMIGVGWNFIVNRVEDVATCLNTIVAIVAHSNISMPNARIKCPWAYLVSNTSLENGASKQGGY